MPPCPISSPPPALALALPWEAPGQYAGVLFLILGYGYAGRYLYAKAPTPLTRWARIGFMFVVVGSVIALVGVAVNNLALMPYMDNIATWGVTQGRRFASQPCSLDALNALERDISATASTRFNIMLVVTWCGLVMFVIGLMIMRAARRGPAAEVSGA
jgi:hypothetical protein